MPAPKHQPVPKKLLFAQEYLVDQNGTQAAIRAGYSAKSAQVQASKMLLDPIVKEYLAKHTAKRVERLNVDADRWLEEVNSAAFLDPDAMFADDGTLLPMSQIPERHRRAIAGFEVIETFEMREVNGRRQKVWTGYLKKVKLVSKEGTLNLCAKHLGFIKDKLEVTVKDELLETLEEMKARREAARAKVKK